MEVPAVRVRQWMASWETVTFDAEERRRRPLPHFYLFSLSAAHLKRLAGIQRRSRQAPGSVDLGIQRRHDEDRSAEIRRYLMGGLPWSESKAFDLSQFRDIQMPGWLPTAVVVNVLLPTDERWGAKVEDSALITVRDNDSSSTAALSFPDGSDRPGWRTRGLAPVEVIDGQHRLWAFEDDFDPNFELPVVAFFGLDIGWQAYLFWTINIKPKRISPSLAFDLYPLLRTQTWLEAGAQDGPMIYRETRAQELTEALWSYPDSPWYQRINMLGEPGSRDVSQAAFVRSLLASFIKKAEGRRVAIGGLFGSRSENEPILPWTRTQQAALLIFIWLQVKHSIVNTDQYWASFLDGINDGDESERFEGRFTLLATDQGVRAILQVANDLLFVNWRRFELGSWRSSGGGEELSSAAIRSELNGLNERLPDCTQFIRSFAETIVGFDWRSSSTPGLDFEERQMQAAFRGSGGYSLLRRQLLRTLWMSGRREVSSSAEIVADRLGYDLS